MQKEASDQSQDDFAIAYTCTEAAEPFKRPLSISVPGGDRLIGISIVFFIDLLYRFILP